MVNEIVRITSEFHTSHVLSSDLYLWKLLEYAVLLSSFPQHGRHTIVCPVATTLMTEGVCTVMFTAGQAGAETSM